MVEIVKKTEQRTTEFIDGLYNRIGKYKFNFGGRGEDIDYPLAL